MKDWAASITASALIQSPGPQIKQEIKREPTPDSNQQPIPQPSESSPPLKRSRSHDESDQREEKRLKLDEEPVYNLVGETVFPPPEESVDSQLPQQTQAESLNSLVNNEPEQVDRTAEQTTEDLVNGIMASLSNDAGNTFASGDMHMDRLIDSILLSEPISRSPIKSSLWNEPVHYTRRTHALPALRTAAVDVLKALSDNPFEDTWATLNDQPGSEIAQEYARLKSYFDMLRNYFSTSFPLLYADNLDVSRTEEREVIRIANLATACASMFGTNEITLEDLNQDFLNIFVPNDQVLSSEVAELYVGLKTQMFLILLESEPQANREQALETLFATGLEDALKKRHPNSAMSVNETVLIETAKARKAMLLNESSEPENIRMRV